MARKIGQLNERQLAFVKEYLTDLNGTQAAIRAGYAAKGAEVTASKLLTNPKVAAEIARQTKARFEKLDIDADALLKRAETILLADPQPDPPTIVEVSPQSQHPTGQHAHE